MLPSTNKNEKMKKLVLLLFVTLLSYSTYAQSDNKINIGTIETIDSKILGEERTVWVYSPDEGPGNIFGKTTYPVVYLLDARSNFHSVTGMIRQLSAVNGNNLCPKMIVVGILNTNRDRDLTPNKGDVSHPYVNENRAAASGGGANFMAFMEKELMPFIESKYPTEPYKMLIGHSFGGLTVMNAFLKHTELFNSYLSIDPSMWWANESLLNEIKNTPLDEKFDNKSLYLAIANTLEDGMEFETIKEDTTFGSEHIRSILKLDDYLKKTASGSFKYQGKYYSEDDHGSVPLISEYDALRYIFDFYPLSIKRQEMMDPESDIYNKVINHSKKLSQEFGREISPAEELVNNLGYQLLEAKQLKKSEQFFQLNITNYPTSFNVYDSMADYYIETDQKKKAIVNLKKAVELGGMDYSKEKLEALLKE